MHTSSQLRLSGQHHEHSSSEAAMLAAILQLGQRPFRKSTFLQALVLGILGKFYNADVSYCVHVEKLFLDEFKCPGSTIQSSGQCTKEVKTRVQAGWSGWRLMCDRRIAAKDT